MNQWPKFHSSMIYIVSLIQNDYKTFILSKLDVFTQHDRQIIKAEVRRSCITTIVRDQSPRSHHKGITNRVRTGNQRYPAVLGYAFANLDKISLNISTIQSGLWLCSNKPFPAFSLQDTDIGDTELVRKSAVV